MYWWCIATDVAHFGYSITCSDLVVPYHSISNVVRLLCFFVSACLLSPFCIFVVVYLSCRPYLDFFVFLVSCFFFVIFRRFSCGFCSLFNSATRYYCTTVVVRNVSDLVACNRTTEPVRYLPMRSILNRRKESVRQYRISMYLTGWLLIRVERAFCDDTRTLPRGYSTGKHQPTKITSKRTFRV